MKTLSTSQTLFHGQVVDRQVRIQTEMKILMPDQVLPIAAETILLIADLKEESDMLAHVANYYAQRPGLAPKFSI